MPMNDPLPLFPLQAVLLPGAALGLRVFERRYLDMVAECGRSGRGRFAGRLRRWQHRR